VSQYSDQSFFIGLYRIAIDLKCNFKSDNQTIKTDMNKTTGIILIVAALLLGFLGVNKIDESGGTVDILGIKISAEDEGAKQTGYIFLGLAALCLIGGVVMMRRQ
jgi:hypothetical protein